MCKWFRFNKGGPKIEPCGTPNYINQSISQSINLSLSLSPPPQAMLEVCDRTGSVCVVLWNSVCVSWYRCLKPGDIISLRRYRVKQHYQAETDDIGTHTQTHPTVFLFPFKGFFGGVFLFLTRGSKKSVCCMLCILWSPLRPSCDFSII